MGGLDEWREHYGGFRPESSRDGRRVVDHDLTMQFIGMTANALEPGEEAGYWHTHARVEELYVFLAGRGQMGLDDDVVDVGPGTVVRVGPGRLAHVAVRAGQPRAAALALHPRRRLRAAALPRRQPARQRPPVAVVRGAPSASASQRHEGATCRRSATSFRSRSRVALSSVPIMATIFILLSPNRSRSALPFLIGWVIGLFVVVALARCSPRSCRPRDCPGSPTRSSEASRSSSAWRCRAAPLTLRHARRQTEHQVPKWLKSAGELGPW